jgi:hypothetical protein
MKRHPSWLRRLPTPRRLAAVDAFVEAAVLAKAPDRRARRATKGLSTEDLVLLTDVLNQVTRQEG